MQLFLRKSFFSGSVLLALYLLSFDALAARDGTIGETSTGEISIRLQINQGIQISNLQDISIDVSNQVNKAIEVKQQCCVSASESGRFSIAATPDQTGQAFFSLSSANQETIQYQLYFKGDLNAGVGDQLQPNVSSKQYPLSRNGPNCNGQNNAEIALKIPAEQINQASNPVYNGFLNLTVAIE